MLGLLSIAGQNCSPTFCADATLAKIFDWAYILASRGMTLTLGLRCADAYTATAAARRGAPPLAAGRFHVWRRMPHGQLISKCRDAMHAGACAGATYQGRCAASGRQKPRTNAHERAALGFAADDFTS